MQISELKATNHSQNRNFKNVKVVNEKYFFITLTMQMSSAFPPMAYKFHSSRNIFIIPRSFDSS